MLGSPSFNLRPKPKPRSASAEIDYRTRHVRIAGLVLADTVPVGESEDLRDRVSVDEVFDCNTAGHQTERTCIGNEPAYARNDSVRAAI